MSCGPRQHATALAFAGCPVNGYRQWTQSVEGDPSQHAFSVGGGGFGETFEGTFDSRSRRASPAAARSGDLGVRCAAELGAFPFRGPTPSVSSAPLLPSAPDPTARSGPSSEAPVARPTDSGLVPPNDASGVCPPSTGWVRGGAFVAAGERATTRVEPLCVDVHEATVDHFAACVAAGVCREPDRGGACNWGVAAHRDHPINCLSQPEAVVYCNWARERLPTVVESEWVARGGQTGKSYPWGDAVALGQLCWSGSALRRNTCPVGAFPDGHSKEGIADLIGNVVEWTSTPSNRGTQRFRLGGGSFADTDAAQVRWTVDWDEVGETHAPTTGVRCVTTAKP